MEWTGPRALRVCFNPSALRVRVEEAELPLPKKVGLDEGGEGREEVDGEGELIRPRSRRTDERRTRAGLRRRRVAARERAGRSERPFYGIIRSPSAANDTRALPISFFPPTIRRRRGGRGERTRSLVTCPLPFPPAGPLFVLAIL